MAQPPACAIFVLPSTSIPTYAFGATPFSASFQPASEDFLDSLKDLAEPGRIPTCEHDSNRWRREADLTEFRALATARTPREKWVAPKNSATDLTGSWLILFPASIVGIGSASWFRPDKRWSEAARPVLESCFRSVGGHRPPLQPRRPCSGAESGNLFGEPL